jgi:hypothetical protein
LVLSPTGSINLGFTTEGRLAAVLIITFSWGFQLGGYTYIIPTSTPHHHWGNPISEEKKLDPQRQNCDDWIYGLYPCYMKTHTLTSGQTHLKCLNQQFH